MLYNISKVLPSVKSKLVFLCLAMIMTIALLSGYAFTSVGGAGAVVKDTFDRPLPATNFARSAAQIFNDLEIEVLKQTLENGPAQSLETAKITPLLETFKTDLDVARERSVSKRAAPFFDDVDASLTQWENLVLTPRDSLGSDRIAQADGIAFEIKAQLGTIIELQTNASLRARESALKETDEFKFYILLAGALALILTVGLSAWIAVTIINSLKTTGTGAPNVSRGNDETEHLRQVQTKAEATDKAKSLLIASVSPELRTRLNTVIDFSDILEEHHKGPGGNPNHAAMAGLISQNGAEILNIIKDVLDVTKGANTAEIDTEMRRVDLVKIVWVCLKTISAEAKAKNIRLLYARPEQPVHVTGDPLRLQKLLLNLLSNAIEYNEPGGAVKVKVTHVLGQKILMDVTDNGIGIAESDLSRIMQPVVQADSGLTPKHDGDGPGLTLVKQIVESHQGKFNIHSRPDKGTVVRIAFPAIEQTSAGPVELSA